LPTLELVACRRLQLAQVVGAVVGHRLPLEPGPQVLHWIEVGGVEREEGNLDFLLDAALVQPKQAVGARQTGDDSDVGPVKVKLDDGCLPLGCPGSHDIFISLDGPLVRFLWTKVQRAQDAPDLGLAGRPCKGTARNASIPPSSNSALHVYTVCRATPTSSAISTGVLPFCSSHPARTRFLVA